MMDINKVVTQKVLCHIATLNNAMRLGSNCHEYEATLRNREKLVHILNIDVKRDSYGYYMLENYKIYVSCGLYGNTGQMHYIEWYDNANKQNSCYVYYTKINYNKD